MDTATRKRLESEVARRVLSEHERVLLERADRKSMAGLAQLYRGVYEGENGVREAVERARAKVRAHINGRVDERNTSASAATVRPLEHHLSLDPDDNSGGVPVRSVPAGTLSGAAGARPTLPPEATPPKARRQPSSADPSRERLPAVRDTPAPASRPSPTSVNLERQEKILALLRDNAEMPTMEIARALGIPTGSIQILGRMVQRGLLRIARQEGNRKFYALPAPAEKPKPAASTAVAEREPPPAPPPFAGVEAAQTHDYLLHEHAPAAQSGNLLDVARVRYAHTLMDRLERLDVPHGSGPHLMDRIERVLGLVDGRAEQTQIAAGAGEPG